MLRRHVLLMGFIGKGDRCVSFENNNDSSY